MDKFIYQALVFIYQMGKRKGEEDAIKSLLLYQERPKEPKEDTIHPFVSSIGSAFLLVAILMVMAVIFVILKDIFAYVF